MEGTIPFPLRDHFYLMGPNLVVCDLPCDPMQKVKCYCKGLSTSIPALEGGVSSLLALTNLFPMNDVGTRRDIRLG